MKSSTFDGPTPTLQWGRDLSVAEGRAGWRRRRLQNCFNGAATFRSRKAASPWKSAESTLRFNGAATFRSRKVVTPTGGPGNPRSFNGAATFRSRKVHNARRLVLNFTASMGPRPFGRGRF